MLSLALSAMGSPPGERSSLRTRPHTIGSISSFYATVNTPEGVETWITDLFSKKENFSDFLVEKKDVIEIWVQQVKQLEKKAMAYLREVPLDSLDTSLLETHYLVSKTAYQELIASTQLEAVLTDVMDTVEPDAVSVDATDSLEATLGHIDYVFDETALKLHEKLLEDGIKAEEDFVEHFNRLISDRSSLVQVALLRCEILCNQLYFDPQRRRQIKEEQVPSTREGLITLFACEDPTIKSYVIKRLVDVLKADPIATESYMNLPKHIQKLTEYIDLSESQNLDVTILAKLIEAYAAATKNIWLHSQRAGSASVIQSTLRKKIWSKTEEFQKQNSQKNPTIDFWINFAIQAIQRVPTEISSTEEIAHRAFLFSSAILNLTVMIAGSVAKQQLDVSESQVQSIIKDLSEAFYHIPHNAPWFEPLLAFKYMCHLVRYCPSCMPQLVEMALRYKISEQDPNLFFGIISALESLLLDTTEPKTTESSLKILVTLIFFDNKIIQQRIVQALLKMQQSGKETLSITSESLLHLIYQSREDLKELFPRSFFREERTLSTRFNALLEQGRTLCTHVMSLLIRFTVDIRTESGMSSESLVGQLTRSMTGDLDGYGSARIEHMMNALKIILPNPLMSDAEGNSFLHLCVKRGNGDLIPIAMRIFSGLIDPNAVNHEGRTALILCVAPGLPPFLEGVEILSKIKGINPNIKDKFGRTFWHYLAEIASFEEFQHILEKIDWKEGKDIDERGFKGLTPFMLCMKQDTPSKSLAIAKLLIKHGINVHIPDPNGVTGLEMAIRCSDHSVIRAIPPQNLISSDLEQTCFIMAAELGNEEILDYLFTALPDHHFTRAEVLAIMRGSLIPATNLGIHDKMIAIIQKHIASHKYLAEACRSALPDFSWRVESGTLTFKFKGSDISRDEILAAVSGKKCTQSAAEVFGISSVMLKCFHNSNAKSEELTKLIRDDPSQLFLTDVLGRTVLQIALLEASAETKNTILLYNRQKFDNPDYKGNQPLHYAAAILDHVAYRNILQKIVSTTFVPTKPASKSSLAMPKNNLDLTPLVLALMLPKKMLPEAISDINPYPHRNKDAVYSDDIHASFCHILDDTLSWYRSQNLLKHDSSAETNPYNYKSIYGWNLLHYAAVYGTTKQAYAIAQRLPDLFFDLHKKGGRIPLQQALFRGHLELAEAMIRGWLNHETQPQTLKKDTGLVDHLQLWSEREKSKTPPLSSATKKNTLTELSRHLMLHGLSLWAILAEVGALDLIIALDKETPISNENAEKRSYFVSSGSFDINQYNVGSNPFAIIIQTAIRKNNIQILSHFAKTQPLALLELQDETHSTPLMLACSLRKTECINLLLKLAKQEQKLEEYIKAKNKSGQTAIHILCSISRTKALEQILSEKKDPVHENHAILDAELESCLTLLLNNGASLSDKDDGGNTAPHLICGHNHACLIQIIWDHFISKIEFKKIFNSINDDYRTPIFSAVANTSLEAFQTLMRLRRSFRTSELLDLNKTDVNGYTLLHVAAQEGQKYICEALILAGVDLTTRDERGENAIHKAAFNRRISVLQYLLELSRSGPNRKRIMAEDLAGMSALHKAILLPPSIQRRHQRRYYEKRIADALTGSSILTESKAERLSKAHIVPMSYLSISILSNTQDQFDPSQITLINEVISCLLDFGFSMEEDDRLGLTPWHYLMRGPYSAVLEHVFDYYSQRKTKLNFSSLQSHSGETVAHLSAKFGQKSQLALVLPHMSAKSISKKTTTGFTAASYALMGDHLECFRLLMDAGCRIDQTTRRADARSSSHKGDNLLHQIAKKTDLTASLEKVFKEISSKNPKLLTEKNSSEKTVLEELTEKGHLSLLPIAIARMPNNEASREAITRALTATQSQLSSRAFTTRSHASPEGDIEHKITTIHRILAYSNIQSYLGKDLRRLYKPTSSVGEETIESLVSKAEDVQTPSLHTQVSQMTF